MNTATKQLNDWVIGISNHDNVLDQCCPDFSCCGGKLAPEEARMKFATAFYNDDKKTQYSMLGEFLGGMLADKLPEKKVHIAGES